MLKNKRKNSKGKDFNRIFQEFLDKVREIEAERDSRLMEVIKRSDKSEIIDIRASLNNSGN